MRWSYSASTTFAQCPRKWCYANLVANAIAKDPLRKEAHLLKQLGNIHAWRGKIVDHVISEFIVKKLNNREELDLEKILEYANWLIEEQLAFGKTMSHRNATKSSIGHQYCAFFELEYGGTLDDATVAKARDEIKISLTNFHNSKLLSEIRKDASYLIPQRALQFSYANVSVSATPDLIVFFNSATPMIVDWKVQTPHHKDHWIQLGIYGLALSKAKPHNDFPKKWNGVIADPRNIVLSEFQLLKNREQQYAITDEDILDIHDYIFNSADQMQGLVNGCKFSDLDITLFPTAKSPSTCMSCQFRKICWKGMKYESN